MQHIPIMNSESSRVFEVVNFLEATDNQLERWGFNIGGINSARFSEDDDCEYEYADESGNLTISRPFFSFFFYT